MDSQLSTSFFIISNISQQNVRSIIFVLHIHSRSRKYRIKYKREGEENVTTFIYLNDNFIYLNDNFIYLNVNFIYLNDNFIYLKDNFIYLDDKFIYLKDNVI